MPGFLKIDRNEYLDDGRLKVLEYRRFKWRRRGGSITLQGIDVDLPRAPTATIRLVPGPLR